MVLPHYMGRSKEIDINEKKDKDKRKGIGRQDSFSFVGENTPNSIFYSVFTIFFCLHN